MKSYHKFFLTIICVFIGINAQSQTNDPKALVNEGVALFDKCSYNDAIEKYKEALKINPEDLQADYELAYTLQTINKGLEGIPYIERF
jgi:tetratricopeptide (TPR) repeat protein